MTINKIAGSVTVSKGFKANGIHCGIRKNKTKKDLAVIISDVQANVAAVYTQNLIKGAPITITKKNIVNGVARAIICNSGNANTCNADGIEIAEKMCELVADATNIAKTDVVIASTGVIGQALDISVIEKGIPSLISGLNNTNGGTNAAEAIMTTDTVPKECAVSFELDGKLCHLGGIAKGVGMINPNMATLLVFLTTDVAISSSLLQNAISDDVKGTFNMVSVDGDTSTNDMLVILANGLAENNLITTTDSNYAIFCKALNIVTEDLCRKIAFDGEGATKLIQCDVINAKDLVSARKAAKSVISSALLKSALNASDANWGRVLCALGYSGATLNPEKIDVSFESQNGTILVCKNGYGVDFDENIATKILSATTVIVNINLNDGDFKASAWGCDLTEEYVRINGGYRT
ncbi:MAG: bifunctional glutamate N-acetyltransferase/amino-acid acetyltransferase ArgJ [Christensenellaceae bacterium]|jgi:glutamate N-acetyltransferase/amino-acid N-acetyltransferase|nr:bifunctional glutamate N-acetyltransferase/amino-acid acetyltransferase ArgJ [Christensenellaceae bacterium]